MHLKSLEMIGFKSFADKTRLTFEPGMTAVVGPNGCGKSNISDAIRWVLGEQKPTAMRGSKMEDVVFSGTDSRKPVGMAEVSLTFTNCEAVLETEFHEVTITRRFFRSGEGQYFLNRTPCRLKDIHRLFLGTGIGTSSYSFMEQGRIDRVLSSRPEDRRAIFEEASGITKFKADKAEAIRKLDHTEANLLRLADVIREVKRQIGSLQRQAGKARRYKTFREQLRSFDIFATRERLRSTDQTIQTLEKDIQALDEQITSAATEVTELESGSTHLRRSIHQTETEIGTLQEQNVEARSNLDHTQELIRVNQQRIKEYEQWSERDAREVDSTRKQIDSQQDVAADLTAKLQQRRQEKTDADAALQTCNVAFEEHRSDITSMRTRIHELRDESMGLESRVSQLQNLLAQLDAKQHASSVQKERLHAEQTQLERVVTGYDKRMASMQEDLTKLEGQVLTAEGSLHQGQEALATNQQQAATHRDQISTINADLSARQAQLELLQRSDADEGLPSGARRLLDDSNPLGVDAATLMGSLADRLDIDKTYRTALLASLRAWVDAVLVTDTRAAIDVLKTLRSSRVGSARLLAADTDATLPTADIPQGIRLSDQVSCDDALKPLARRLLGHVIVIPSLDALPSPLTPDITFVTADGAVVRSDGRIEFYMPDTDHTNPLARRHMVEDLTTQVTKLQKTATATQGDLDTCLQQESVLIQTVENARKELERHRDTCGIKKGEIQIVSTEAEQAQQRLETVSWELSELNSQEDSGNDERTAASEELEQIRQRRQDVTQTISQNTNELHKLETTQSDLQRDVTEKNIQFARLNQDVQHMESRSDAVAAHLEELSAVAENRAGGIVSYTKSIGDLQSAIKQAEQNLVSLKGSLTSTTEKADSLRRNREKQAEELELLESSLAETRQLGDTLRSRQSTRQLEHKETTMRRQNTLDRLASEYAVALDQVEAEAEPDWTSDKPSQEALETHIAELRTKLEAMGPVNLVAIEEHQELEERYTFLTQQEQDLVKAKQQLMDMIRKINRTTSDMFQSTFVKVNENFQAMFRTLFDGGTAKLVLVNEEDILECGIEIIARPPGKRLQNVSLLSGGERTMTAVALLFAIYMIKPSPFCLLDELDAALDDSNIGRFINILKGFLEQSQFLVITHNRQTIAEAGVLYGVTMYEKGVSGIVSMKFNDNKKAPEPVTAAT